MPDPLSAALTAIVVYLRALNRDQSRPDDALQRLAGMRERMPGLELELVWTEQAFDGSLHYDVLIRTPGVDTLSVSACPERALPWPLRGVQPWRDSHLLRVNETVLEVVDAISQLELLWENTPMMQQLVDGCLVSEALRQIPVEVSAVEIQEARDAIRRHRGLLSAADTLAWMEATGVDRAALEKLAVAQARAVKLREQLVGDKVDAYLADHLADFDRLQLARVQLRSEALARDFADQVHRGVRSFLELAQHAFRAEPAMSETGLFWSSWRFRLPTELQAALAAAAAGEITGPVPSADGYWIVQLLAVEPAVRDPATRRAALAVLFKDWLTERRRSARIEWFLGKAPNKMAPFAGDAGMHALQD